ncbi:MAG: formate--tetrahydrofolate ligase [Rhodospirillales bacterium]|nr:formate--tetrahydrofolate ligase [Rhodospirillales bacterium]
MVKAKTKSDIEIARNANMRPVVEIAKERFGINEEYLDPYGHYKAKISLDHITGLPDRSKAKLILVTAMTPTAAGEGKTTTTVGLGDALNRVGKNASICLREPSLGPCFGMKGGAAGGGYAQVVPMEEINLHFTGDFHAIGAANNLLSALIDNHIYWGHEPALDPRRVTWRRVVDMNDRALRSIVTSLGGVANGFPKEAGFDITVASEVMAIFCLAQSTEDLNNRLANIVVGQTRERKPVYARDLKADGLMTALLKDAIKPNLVQTLENNPAFVHGGPFANIAHGCNSVIATKTALKLSDYVVTEAGFGADLGAEKFFDIKCRKAGLTPHAAVVVATVRALKMHGGVEKEELGKENLKALKKGLDNLTRHVRNVLKYKVPAVVAINRFVTDSDSEIELIKEQCAKQGVEAIDCTHWANGGAGAEDLANKVVELADNNEGSSFNYLYPDDMALWDKVHTIAHEIYGASEIVAEQRIRNQFRELEQQGAGNFPICVAKTQYSFSTDGNLKNAPSDHVVQIKEVRLANGAEFLVVICGDIMTMPGLPRVPAAHEIRVDSQGNITGLF